MKRTFTLLLAIMIAFCCALPAAAAPTGVYNYYVALTSHSLRVLVDSSWEDLALSDTVRYELEESEADAGAIRFSYVDENGLTPLCAYAVRHVNVAYAPIEGAIPTWSETKGDYVIEFYMLAQVSGAPYDVVLEAFADPKNAVEFLTPDEKWGFTCLTPEGVSTPAADVFLGAVTMVNAWATYCAPCIQEMPYLGELAAEYADKGLRIVGVITDVPEGEDVEYAQYLIQETHAHYPHVLTNNALNSGLLAGMQYVPTTVFLNAHGVEIGRLVGSYEKADWAAIIEEMLKR